jgi:hypothetical protein
VCAPSAVGVYVTWQLAIPPVPASVQLANALALASSKKLTCPVGVVGVAETSVTVAVQVVGELTGTVGGLQLTVV